MNGSLLSLKSQNKYLEILETKHMIEIEANIINYKMKILSNFLY